MITSSQVTTVCTEKVTFGIVFLTLVPPDDSCLVLSWQCDGTVWEVLAGAHEPEGIIVIENHCNLGPCGASVSCPPTSNLNQIAVKFDSNWARRAEAPLGPRRGCSTTIVATKATVRPSVTQLVLLFDAGRRAKVVGGGEGAGVEVVMCDGGKNIL